MTYVYETNWSGDNIWVEYCHSSVSNAIKVIEMKVDGKFHRTNWMGPTGRVKLMDELEADMTDRVCETGVHSSVDDVYESDIDLDRDVPTTMVFDGC